MKPIDEAMLLDDPLLVQEEIRVRRELQKQMIGDLYPSILEDEIERLYNRKFELSVKPAEP